MNDEKRIESLMKLVEFRVGRWQNRRMYEWRTSAGLWALLAAGIVYLKPHGVGSLYLFSFFLIISVIAHAWFWVRPNYVSNQMDIVTAFYFAEHAEQLVIDGSPTPGVRPTTDEIEKRFGGLKFMKAGVCQFEVIATALMAFGLIIFLATSVKL